MTLNELLYSQNANQIQVVISAKDLRDFADNLIEFATRKIKERDEPEYYSREELATLLHVSQPTLLNYRKKGILPEPVTIEGRVLYDKAKVREAIEGGKMRIRIKH